MNKKTLSWLVIGAIVLIALFVLPSLWMWGRGGWFNHSYGMMGSYYPGSYHMMGGFGFGWLVPVLLLGLVIAVGVWAGNSLSRRNYSGQKRICPNCSKSVEEDWKTCPYCSTAL